MYDLNFFDATKGQHSKNKGFMVFIILLLVIVLLVNAALFVGRHLLFEDLNKDIESMQAFIDDPATKEAIAEAANIKQEAALVEEYHTLLASVESNLNLIKQINSELLDDIRQLTPINVFLHNMQISGRYISITCTAASIVDVLDMYHAFTESTKFVNVSISSVSISVDTDTDTDVDTDENTNEASFSMNFTVMEDYYEDD